MSQPSKSSFIFRCKESTGDEELSKLKQDVVGKGGTITHEYTLFKGFAATLPEDSVTALEEHPHIEAVEKDQEVKIQ
ncbi:protease propeptide/inhibitor [Nadsonia fulvescens var. elongata DSM 6958]|uniref:Protease propeptide/inhibitor n=1 Tax=Nadsonia fulvescens var. elongata DSM 6958 TaxID=857566 RepID=A0A1E3PI62_9ASCO|nr:protease propeptide/inhibitor [Nadsonia fulvescens var. elongata DSM 6958]